jgi:hypothetical protein
MSGIGKRNTLLADVGHFFQLLSHNFEQFPFSWGAWPVSINNLEFVDIYAYDLIPTRAHVGLASVIGLDLELTTRMIILRYSNVLEWERPEAAMRVVPVVFSS